MGSMTMTIRVPTDLHDKLARLAHGTRRSRSFLAAEALARYVERELAIIEGIQAAIADAAAGRTVPHEVVMAEAREIVEAARRKRTASH